jgi:hypothetical protein
LKGVRGKKTAWAFYGFGDALGSGFGATIQINGKIHYEYGQWCAEVTEKRSPNWRELNNLVEAIVRMVVETTFEGLRSSFLQTTPRPKPRSGRELPSLSFFLSWSCI